MSEPPQPDPPASPAHPEVTDSDPPVSPTDPEAPPAVSEAAPTFSQAAPTVSEAAPSFSEAAPTFSQAAPTFSQAAPAFSAVPPHFSEVPPPDLSTPQLDLPVSATDPPPPPADPAADVPDWFTDFGAPSSRVAVAEEPPPAPATFEPGSTLAELAALDATPVDPAVAAAARLPSILESLLFAADHPLTVRDLAELVGEPDTHKVEGALVVLGGEWSPRGIQLHAVAGGWQFRTHPANAVWVQRLVAQKPVRLTRSQLETMAIIAYRQPITRPEIDEIRGVDSGGTLKTLLDRSLVRILGKKEEPGRPLLYGTTKEFLEFFNLRDLRELPTLREFLELSEEHRAQVEALARMAPPGAVEADANPAGTIEQIIPPLQRVELSDAPLEEDLGHIDQLIEEAGNRARTAAEALGTAMPESEGEVSKQPPAREKDRGKESSDEGD